MAHRLELAYNWRLPVMFSSVGLVLCVAALVRGQAPGWWAVILVLVALWGAFTTLVWLRTRASLMVDGPVLESRHRFHYERVDAADVTAVRQFRTPHGPSHKLLVRTDGADRTVTVPTALLRGGRSALFTWILTEAPAAELDQGSRKTVQELQWRGLIP